jgi:UDP-N-acetylglucosamine pyrophosphorylase
MLPAVNFEGKIMMQSPSSIKLAPNGNGSLFDAIRQRQDVQAVIKNLAYL